MPYVKVQISVMPCRPGKDLVVSDVVCLLQAFKQKDGKICFIILMRLLCQLCEKLAIRQVKIRL